MFHRRGSLQSSPAVSSEGLQLRRFVRPLQISPKEQGRAWGSGNEAKIIDSGMDEPLAKDGEIRVRRSRTYRNKRAIPHIIISSSLGLSHSLGHKLGATYGIPHGITSVSEGGF